MRPHHLLALTAGLALSDPAWSMDCRKMIETHGFKAEAQATCGFGQPENQGLVLAGNAHGARIPA